MSSNAEPLVDRIQHVMSSRTAALGGVVGAIVTIALTQADTVGFVLGCISVGILYAVYPLGSIAWGTARERLVEWSYVVIGGACLALAITVDPRWLAAAWAAHGVWDVLHRVVAGWGLKAIPRWYLDFCVVWDLLAGLGLALIY